MLTKDVIRLSIVVLAVASAWGAIPVFLWGEEIAAAGTKRTAKAAPTAGEAMPVSGVERAKSPAIPASPKSDDGTSPDMLKTPAAAGAGPIAESFDDAAMASSGRAETALLPENLRDPGFDRYLDLRLLSKAWEEKDASALADVAMQLREGERILLRPYRGFSSQQLLQEAVRTAAETKDGAALLRLRKIAELIGSSELKTKLAVAEKLAGEARATDPALQVSIGEVTPDVYSDLWEFQRAIRDASLTGDAIALKQIEDELAAATAIPEKQKKYLEKRLQESQTAAAAIPDSQKQLAQALDKLADSSRRGGGGHGTHGGGNQPRGGRPGVNHPAGNHLVVNRLGANRGNGRSDRNRRGRDRRFRDRHYHWRYAHWYDGQWCPEGWYIDGGDDTVCVPSDSIEDIPTGDEGSLSDG